MFDDFPLPLADFPLAVGPDLSSSVDVARGVKLSIGMGTLSPGFATTLSWPVAWEAMMPAWIESPVLCWSSCLLSWELSSLCCEVVTGGSW